MARFMRAIPRVRGGSHHVIPRVCGGSNLFCFLQQLDHPDLAMPLGRVMTDVE